jgi:hypothetical protein
LRGVGKASALLVGKENPEMTPVWKLREARWGRISIKGGGGLFGESHEGVGKVLFEVGVCVK